MTNLKFTPVQLGNSELRVPPICLGTMTFGEQVSEKDAHAIMDLSLERGINFFDTAEIYSVPTAEATFGSTETIIGNWFAKDRGRRSKITLASKVAGSARGMPWVRKGTGMTAQDILSSCEGSLRRLQTDVIDLYQIHWPERHVPAFGAMYYDPKLETSATSIHEQLETLGALVKQGKIRYIGLSNETPYGVHEFVRLAQMHNLPQVVSVQNPYCLINRTVENALDETLHRLNVALLAYSPLGFGLLTGKYDASGTVGATAPKEGRIAKYESVRKQRWGRQEALDVSRLYNQLALDNGMTPTQMALAFCYTQWRVQSTIIGVTSTQQLDENLQAFGTTLSPELLAKIDHIRWIHRDPAV